MTSPWNIENKYTTFDVISWYIEKRCNTLWRHANFCGLCQKRENTNGFLKGKVCRSFLCILVSEATYECGKMTDDCLWQKVWCNVVCIIVALGALVLVRIFPNLYRTVFGAFSETDFWTCSVTSYTVDRLNILFRICMVCLICKNQAKLCH
jgi:hypothetical protein